MLLFLYLFENTFVDFIKDNTIKDIKKGLIFTAPYILAGIPAS
jgi:hypothetical protein